MKEVLLLVDELHVTDYYSSRKEYKYYEMNFSEFYNEEDVKNTLSKYFETVDVKMLYNGGVSVVTNGVDKYLEIITALKIGNRYFGLNELPEYKNEKQ